MRYHREPPRPADSPAAGVVLCNLGSPDAPRPAPVRRYLREFLWDQRVVELPRPLWWLLLNLIVIPLRHRHSTRMYQQIWQEDGSPLVVTSRTIAAALQHRLAQELSVQLPVVEAMRYGTPSLALQLDKLRRLGCRKLLIVPLFPQYSGTTTASIFDQATRVLQSWRWIPELRFITSYYDNPGYLAALAGSISEHWQERGQPDHLVLSFHSIPSSYAEAGDPYPEHCHTTATLLAQRLELADEAWSISFQSRLGPTTWLSPRTAELLASFGRRRLGRVDVLCPGFAADCLETLEEIAITGARTFAQAGGSELSYIPALNARPAHITALTGIVSKALSDWVT